LRDDYGFFEEEEAGAAADICVCIPGKQEIDMGRCSSDEE
jgi:hypothetical protein